MKPRPARCWLLWAACVTLRPGLGYCLADDFRDGLISSPAPIAGTASLGTVRVSAPIPEAARQREAAEGGSARAQWELANRYLTADGVDRSDAQAFRWMREAAERDHDGAQWQVGWMYFHGKGVPSSYVRALYWYYRCAKTQIFGSRFDDDLRRVERRAGELYARAEPRAQRLGQSVQEDVPKVPGFLRRFTQETRRMLGEAWAGCREIARHLPRGAKPRPKARAARCTR